MAISLVEIVLLATLIIITDAKSSEVFEAQSDDILKEGKSFHQRQDFIQERGPYEGGDMVIPKEQRELMQTEAAIKSGINGQR
ncbi:unnamed protein product, partial [Allacma fusca]